MDTRRRETGNSAPRPELGTETVPVELIELQAVGSSRPGAGRKAIVAVAVLGILAFGAIVVTGKLPTPTTTPLPSAPAVGLATATPSDAIATATPDPATFRPPTTPPTPIPTAPPPQQWTRSDLLPDLDQSQRGMWGVNDNILVLVYDNHAGGADRGAWSILRLSETGARDELAAPPAIADFLAGTVIDDHLWFVARVAGVNDADTTWQLVSTTDGEAWTSLGVTEGLAPLDGVIFLGRSTGGWVAGTWRADPNGETFPEVKWSPDGKHWTPSELPELSGHVDLFRAATIGDTIVGLGQRYTTYDDVTQVVITSPDGHMWQRSSVQLPPNNRASEVACNASTCVMTLSPGDEKPSPTQLVMVSSDGVHWTQATVEFPFVNSDSGMYRLRATRTGFVATIGYASPILLSDDGRSWRAVEVLPPDSQDYFADFAVANDLIAGLVDTSSDIPAAIWLGSLAAMRN